jgi:hypothetical protein
MSNETDRFVGQYINWSVYDQISSGFVPNKTDEVNQLPTKIIEAEVLHARENANKRLTQRGFPEANHIPRAGNPWIDGGDENGPGN